MEQVLFTLNPQLALQMITNLSQKGGLYILSRLVLPLLFAIGFISVFMVTSNPWFVVPGFFLFCVPLFSMVQVYKTLENKYYASIAQSLQYTYNAKDAVPSSGKLFTFGSNRSLKNVLTGIYKDLPFWFGKYTFGVGGGRYEQYYIYTVAALQTRKSLPRVVCVPVNLSTGSLLNSWKEENCEHVSLEGDFNKFFKVYVEKGKEDEALEILQPNTMSMLMDTYKEYGFECSGSTLYIFKLGYPEGNQDEVLALCKELQEYCDLLLSALRSITSN